MVTLKTSRKRSGGFCGSNGTSGENFSDPEVGQSAPHDGLIITGSFNGLLDRVARTPFFDVWYEWSKAKKLARKQKRDPTKKMSDVQQMTGLTREDLELFTTEIPLIEIVDPGADPLLSFNEVYCLVKIFERMVNQKMIPGRQ